MNSVPVDWAQYSVLVVGSGSIGRRHMANLRQLGIRELACGDTDEARLQSAAELGAQVFLDLDEALQGFRPNIVFVCTPPSFHVDHALRALRNGAHVFIEKPLSHSIDGVSALRDESNKLERVVQVGYNLRFHPGIKTLKQLVENDVAGRILWARAEVAQYLPEWRPWQDYRQSYTARKELGGGIILDASHEIDYMLWLLGPPSELACMAGQVSDLDVNVEDCATILLRLRSGAQADIHMDFAQRTTSRSCVLAGENARLEWQYSENHVRVVRPGKPSEVIAHDFETNQMYLSEVKDFFLRVTNGVRTNQSLIDSELTLQVALAARSAAAERKWVSFD